MKKIFIPILASLFSAILFSACGKEKNPEDYVTTENFTVYDSMSFPESEMVSYDEVNSPAESKKITYALNGTNVELLVNDEIVQTLEYYYTPDTASIKVADFNFDGYDDIFIPYESPTDFGYYYCYVPEKNSFEEDSELASIGRLLTISDENTLAETKNDGSTERTIEYRWVNGSLNAVKKTETYKSSEDNKVHTDVYSYDENGAEYLVESD